MRIPVALYTAIYIILYIMYIRTTAESFTESTLSIYIYIFNNVYTNNAVYYIIIIACSEPAQTTVDEFDNNYNNVI